MLYSPEGTVSWEWDFGTHGLVSGHKLRVSAIIDSWLLVSVCSTGTSAAVDHVIVRTWSWGIEASVTAWASTPGPSNAMARALNDEMSATMCIRLLAVGCASYG